MAAGGDGARPGAGTLSGTDRDRAARLRGYLVRDRDTVPGWLSRVDAEIIGEILAHQEQAGIAGGVAEIGLHHGKLFVALCLAMRAPEKAYGIDLFADQRGNLDSSGLGDREALEANLRRFGMDLGRVVLDSRDSAKVVPEDVTGQVGPVRFFSIDGGHWFDIVRSDLELASGCLAPGGVVAVDDFLRPEWPDVSRAFFAWHERIGASRGLVPIAIGFNKLYLCPEEARAGYLARLRGSRFLEGFLTKTYAFLGEAIPIYQVYPLPEWSPRQRAVNYLKLHHPDLYLRLRRLRGRNSG